MPNFLRKTVALTVGYLALSYLANNEYSADIALRGTRTFTDGTVPDKCDDPKKFSFTFDEGPSVYTRGIIQEFDSRQLKASFHVLTTRLNSPAQVDLLREAIKRGHTVGLRFPIGKVPNSMSENELIATLVAESQAFHDVFGEYPRFLRFPWQQFNSTSVTLAQRMGFIVSAWNLDALDYQAASFLQVQTFVRSQIKPEAGTISIHRDIYPIYNETFAFGMMLDTISSSLRLNVVGLDKCLGQTQLWRTNNRDPRVLDLNGVTRKSTSPSPTLNPDNDDDDDKSKSTSSAMNGKSNNESGKFSALILLAISLLALI